MDGKYNGLGVYVWPSGKKFVGRWSDGVKNGHGLYTWPSGKKYDGEYKNGLKHGYGRMQWPDGASYNGGWKENRRHGRGVQTAPDGTLVHCGQWADDEPVGQTEQQSSTPAKSASAKSASPVKAKSAQKKQDILNQSSPDKSQETEDLETTQNTTLSTEPDTSSSPTKNMDVDASICSASIDRRPVGHMLSKTRVVL